MRECQSVSELSIREVSDGRERLGRRQRPAQRQHVSDGQGGRFGAERSEASLKGALFFSWKWRFWNKIALKNKYELARDKLF